MRRGRRGRLLDGLCEAASRFPLNGPAGWGRTVRRFHFQALSFSKKLWICLYLTKNVVLSHTESYKKTVIRMKIKYLLMAAVVALMTACGTASKVPLTGRTHRISVSDAQLLSLSNQEYTKFMASAKRSTDAKNTAMVQRVGRNLANAVETYLRNNGYASEINNLGVQPCPGQAGQCVLHARRKDRCL